MKRQLNLLLLLVTCCMFSCTVNKQTNTTTMDEPTMTKPTKHIMEVTTFNVKNGVSTAVFNKRDAEITSDYTSKQAGFIKRISGVTESGEIGVIVFWESLANADASMNKFMKDQSVADYANMIDGPTMKLTRFTMDKPFAAENSDFVEVMTYQLKADAIKSAYNAINERVTKEVTGPKEGFIQRMLGENEKGEQVVAIFWDNKKNSDAALKPFMSNPLAKQFMGMMNQSTIWMGRYQTLTSLPKTLSNKDKAIALLNSFNTGDQVPISYINPNKYIQHNLSIGDGLAGFGALMQNTPPQGFKAKIHRAFQDGDYVFTHTEYDFFGPKVGFDVFRFENGLIVEHWDNLLEVQPPNPSGRTQFDGATTVTDKDKTAANKQVVTDLLQKVFMQGQMDKIANYISPTTYIQHNPQIGDGLNGLGSAMKAMGEKGMSMKYEKIHKVLGEGNFVLSMSEGKLGAQHTAYYDLFRLENGLIVEHWDVIAPIPPKSEWKNDNGKF